MTETAHVSDTVTAKTLDDVLRTLFTHSGQAQIIKDNRKLIINFSKKKTGGLATWLQAKDLGEVNQLKEACSKQ